MCSETRDEVLVSGLIEPEGFDHCSESQMDSGGGGGGEGGGGGVIDFIPHPSVWVRQ